MRVLIALGCPYVPSLGGSVKVTRTIAETFVARGHDVRVIALARTGVHRGATAAQFLDHLASARIAPATIDEQRIVFTLNGVEVHAIDGAFRIPDYLVDQIQRFDPTWIFLQTEDWRCMLLEAALATAAERVVYFAHASVQLPLGPDSAEPRESAAAVFRRLQHVIAPSQFMATYLKTWADLTAHVVYPTSEVFGQPPFPVYGRAGSGSILMVNACALKGLPIFLALARARPELELAAVRSWGTTADDLAAMHALPNVRVIDPSPNVDAFYSQARILLVPSLWTEVFGLIAIEAMLRGLPVIASNSGGLPEATLGVGSPIPVHLIERYTVKDGTPVPATEIAPQDLDGWLAALDRLADPAEYIRRSDASRTAAMQWLGANGIERLEQVLERLR